MLLYSCRKCLLDNNCFQSSCRGRTALTGLTVQQCPVLVTATRTRPQWAAFCRCSQHWDGCPTVPQGPFLPQVPQQSQQRGASRGSASTAPALPSAAQLARLLSSHGTADTASHHGRQVQMKPRKKATQSTSSSICQMSRDKKNPNRTECYLGRQRKAFCKHWNIT